MRSLASIIMRCKFYGSAVGCRQGDLCRFQHDTSAASSSSSNPQQSSRRPAGDHLGPTRLLADNLNTSRASLAASLDVRYHCRDIRPSSHDEREMARHLVLSAEESGRGVDLPAERWVFYLPTHLPTDPPTYPSTHLICSLSQGVCLSRLVQRL